MRMIVTGAGGQLGTYLRQELAGSEDPVEAWTRPGAVPVPGGDSQVPYELCDASAVRQALQRFQPDVVIHLAAVSNPPRVLAEPERARLVNIDATRTLADWCRDHDCRLVFTSTDMVFDGLSPPYREDAPPCPCTEYGRTKAVGESIVSALETGLVVRIPLLYGPTRCQRPTYYDRCVAALEQGVPQLFFEDEFRTPLDYRTAARLLVALAPTEAVGVVHLGGRERLSRLALMTRVARTLRLDTRLIGGNRLADHPGPEPRPADTSLISHRIGELLPEIELPMVEQAVPRMHGRS